MLRAPKLKPGDVVRIVAPGGPVDRPALEAGLEVIRKRFKLEPRLREDIYSRDRFMAGSDTRRAEEWQEAVSDPDARAIWCARGGYGAMRILPRLDSSRLITSPKLVIGFSDITAIHAALNRNGLVTVHGPMVFSLGTAPGEVLEALEAVLFGSTAAHTIPGSQVICEGRATGPLLGGSLSLLANLCGTPYLPLFRGAVLFFEDIHELPRRIDARLVQLKLAGILESLAGVAVGHITRCDDPDDQMVRGTDVVREFIKALGVPAIEGVPAGHEPRNLAFPLGAVATLIAPPAGDREGPRLVFNQGAAV